MVTVDLLEVYPAAPEPATKNRVSGSLESVDENCDWLWGGGVG